MSEHIRSEAIHDWLDGLLPAGERRRVDAHVDACPACAAELERWAALVASMRELPNEGRPERDLWPDVEARLEEGEPAAGPRPPRRVSFTFPQLWAAGLALALASGALAWVGLGGPRGDQRTALGTPDVAAVPAGVRGVAGGAGYDRALDDLTALLDEGKDLLAPETVAAIERSLAAIDEAIAEAEIALANDPASPVLNRLLASHHRTKLRILRQATAGLLPRT